MVKPGIILNFNNVLSDSYEALARAVTKFIIAEIINEVSRMKIIVLSGVQSGTTLSCMFELTPRVGHH